MGLMLALPLFLLALTIAAVLVETTRSRNTPREQPSGVLAGHRPQQRVRIAEVARSRPHHVLR